MENHENVGVVIRKRAEIDTRQPFRSVKDAVTLFGEKVLAAELYANNLIIRQMHEVGSSSENSKLGSVTQELEETKQSLEKAKEESMKMENCLSSLKQELERTKKELQQLKVSEKAEIFEDFKVVKEEEDQELGEIAFQKKRYVSFANPPSLAQVLIPQSVDEMLQRHPSLRKKKKKPLIPFLGAIFSKKKLNTSP